MKERQPIDANTEIAKMLKLNGEDFKADLTKMLQQAIINMLKTNEKKKHFSKEIQGIF